MVAVSSSHIPVQRILPSLVLAVLLLAPIVSAHPPGVFEKADDYQPQTLTEPHPMDDAAIRAETLAFADNISGQAIYDWDETITTDPTIAYRMMGTPTSDAASQWLLERFQDMGYDAAYKQVFSLDCVALACGTVPAVETQLENVVAVLPGKDTSRWALIGGHYDTREATVGALDNTMGTSTVLHLAEQYKRYADEHGPFEITLVFALWDGEEWGLFGSRQFLDDHAQAKEVVGLDAEAEVDFVAAMSFDMPGLNWPAQNNWVEYTGGEHAILNLRTSPVGTFDFSASYGSYDEELYSEDVIQNFSNYQVLVHHVVHDWLEYPEEWVRVYDDQYGRSDHVPFIAGGVPGMRIQGSHDEEYPHYHQPTDTLENLAILAGGKELLIEGIAAQARAGGATLFYIAKQGDVGHYDPEDPVHAVLSNDDLLDAAESPVPASVPLLAVALALLARRFGRSSLRD